MRLRPDLNALGIDDSTLSRQVRASELVRIRRGAYRDTSDLDPEAVHLELLRAALAQSRTDCVASHVSAGVVHGLPVDRRHLGKVHLMRAAESRTITRNDLVRHFRPDVRSTVVEGFPVTCLDTTALDLARTSSFRDGVAAVDRALRAGASAEVMRAIRKEQRRYRGNPMADRVIEFADARSESAGESHTRVQIAAAGLPAPELQLELVDDEGGMRCDFGWRAQRVIGEFDGRVKYGRQFRDGLSLDEALIAERHREVRLQRLGWWVVRFVWQDLHSPYDVARIVRNGMELAAARFPRAA